MSAELAPEEFGTPVESHMSYTRFSEEYRGILDELGKAMVYEAFGDARRWEETGDELVATNKTHHETFIARQVATNFEV